MLTRRGFLARAAAGVVLVGAGQVLLTAPNAAAAPVVPGYGPLHDDPDGLLALPAGFSYRLVTAAGRTRLESGEPTPGFHDGTGAFARRGGGTLLVVNHEIREPLADAEHPVPPLDGLTYDPAMAGGCTIVEADAQGARLREVVGLAGTSTNCAGGITPWGTWLSCEETETREGEGGAQRDHGYVFEVDPYTPAANRDPVPIRALGRYSHEAACLDPATGAIYLTEDAAGPNGLVYRWSPPAGLPAGPRCPASARPGRRRARRDALHGRRGPAGRRSLARHRGRHALHRRVGPGRRPGGAQAIDAHPARRRRRHPGAEAGRRVVGLRRRPGAGAYIVSSFARDESPVPHDGQVWFLDPKAGTLTLRLRFGRGEDDVDGPDNISVSPWGGLVIAEDGEGSQHLVGATADGRTYPIARADGGEFTGPVYSADGAVLFANVQVPGALYAITGPWRRAG